MGGLISSLREMALRPVIIVHQRFKKLHKMEKFFLVISGIATAVVILTMDKIRGAALGVLLLLAFFAQRTYCPDAVMKIAHRH
jgi:multisubunit Na+/H+ antiporter MnhF subunit